jgi:hypothetical protein
VALTRDTATGYAWDNVPGTYGPDYLSNMRVYGDDKYVVTTKHWLWESSLSTLSNTSVHTKENYSSLVVDYPTASGVDTLRVIQGDTFGEDQVWNLLDYFSFWMHVSNENKIDKSLFDVTFGKDSSSSNDFYYRWQLAEDQINTGWNLVELAFDDADEIHPTAEITDLYLNPKLDVANNNEEIETLYLRYRGNNTGDLRLIFDDFRIKRNLFHSDVKFNKGICLTGDDHVVMPLSNVYLDRGSFECWIKMGVDSEATDAFGTMYSTTLFTLNNNNNDIICLRVKPAHWFELIAGNVRRQQIFTPDTLPGGTFVDRNEPFHMGLVWSNDGTGTPNGDTMRLYINNTLMIASQEPWDVNDTKLAYFKLGGGISQSQEVLECESSAIFDNLKVYNYCKTNFNINKEDITQDIDYLPERFVEISPDGTNFYGPGSENLPLVYAQVPPNDSRRIYVRANKFGNLAADKTTAQVIIDWLTTV